MAQPTLAVLVKLIMLRVLFSYLNKEVQENEVIDLVSCDLSHEAFCKVIKIFRLVREYDT